jgi:hypothetical protein
MTTLVLLINLMPAWGWALIFTAICLSFLIRK